MSDLPNDVASDFYLGDWLVQPSRLRLSRGEVSEAIIEPKMMAVLVMLARRAGEVVTREALMEAVWPDVVVVDDTLSRSVSQLRNLLGRSPAVIETIRSRGYRLVSPVRPATPAVPFRRRWRVAWVAAVGLAFWLAFGLGWLTSRPASTERGPSVMFIDTSNVPVAIRLDEVLPVSGDEGGVLGLGAGDSTFSWHTQRPADAE